MKEFDLGMVVTILLILLVFLFGEKSVKEVEV